MPYPRFAILGTLLLLLTPILATAAGPDPQAVAAKVGDEEILLGEVLQGVSSLAVLGKEDVPNRPGAREQFLERLITSRLLYLDGRDRGLDQGALYQEDLRIAFDPTLAARYLEHHLDRQPVTEEEILAAFHKEQGSAADPLTSERRVRLRKKVLEERRIAVQEAEVVRLRTAAKVAIHRENLDPAGDVARAPLTPVATVDGEVIPWRRLLHKLPTTIKTVDNRVAQAERLVDTHLLAREARRLGLDEEEGLQHKIAAFRRDELTKLVREEIIAREGLDDAGVEREYRAHIANFTLPEQRKVQQIVVQTRAEAEEIRAILKDPPQGVSFYTLARDRSIVPNAKQTLGEIGWVTRAQGHPKLSEAAFSLLPEAISEPVETDAGFHLIRVLEDRAEEVVPFDDDTRERIRARWNFNKIQAYANRLAEEKYKVEHFPEVYKLKRPATATAQEKN